MKVYVMIKTVQQNDFTDGYGEVAQDHEEIVEMRNNEEIAKRRKEELESEDAKDVEECGCDGALFRIETWEVQQENGPEETYDVLLSIPEKELEQMFAHYILRRRYNQAHDSHSQDSLWSGGECEEAEKWLKLFGVDLDYFRIQEMIDGKRQVRAFDSNDQK